MSASLSPVAPPDATTSSAPADSPGDLLVQAGFLFTEGFPIAAGMIGRSALESFLRQLCHLHNCEPTRKKIRHSCNAARVDALLDADVFDKAAGREVARLFDLGNQVVHCEVSDSDTVETLLADVRRFIDDMMEGGAS